VKKLFIIILLFSAAIYGQQREKRPEGFRNFHQLTPTVQVIPSSDSIISVSYLYRIPYRFLVFEKDGNEFKSSARLMVEVRSGDELIKRDFEDRKISVPDFEITQSKATSIEGVINIDLEANDYRINGMVSDLQSEKEIVLSPIDIKGSEYIETKIFNPIIISFAESDCSDKNLPRVVNYGGSIPFSPQEYQVIIPVADTTIESINIELVNNDEQPISQTVTESYITGISTIDCNGKLYIERDDKVQKTKNFVLRNFSQTLTEGLLVLKISSGDNLAEQDFPIRVEWINKPISLRNSEFAIEMLQYIEKEERVSELLDSDSKEYPKLLHEYWKEFDPSPKTEYNEVMEEFYSRIDYAALEFRGLSKRTGLSTDRGKIYIKFGDPYKIERSSTDLGYVMETWNYNNPKQTFIFIDKQGTGNFVLIEG
jgi:GWxTD domain-containing protein